MAFLKKKLSMVLDWALAKTAQLAISQPPDQEHIGKSRRFRAVQRLRRGWGGYNFGNGRATVKRSPEESARRIAAAQAKRSRRALRNLWLAAGQ